MSAGFDMPATPMPTTVELDPIDIRRIDAHMHEPCTRTEYIRADIAQAQIDKMRVARGLQHDAKWHELYRALNMVVARIGRNGNVLQDSLEYSELMSALVEIDNGVYIEPEKWSVLSLLLK